VHCKGSDTGLLTQWLTSLLSVHGSEIIGRMLRHKTSPGVVQMILDFAGPREVDLVQTFFNAADAMLSTLAKAKGCWLLDEERRKAGGAGRIMMETYGLLSARYANQHAKRVYYKIRPKCHAMVHVILDLHWLDPCPNFWSDCCWMDEDFIGKVCRLVRKCDPRAVLTFTCERYLSLLQSELRV
jgi:drug/metabolite transporter superfamily protein YnfA